MFLNKTKFKKLLKEAYSGGGLKAGEVYGGLVLSGSAWASWTRSGDVPNWLKGAVMEIVGELPEEGEIFMASRNDGIQYEIKNNEMLDLPSVFRNSHCTLTDTKITEASKGLRFFQIDQSKKAIAAHEYFSAMIDLRELQGENAPMGPVSQDEKAYFLLYKNEQSAFGFYRISTSDDQTCNVMNALETLDFAELRKR